VVPLLKTSIAAGLFLLTISWVASYADTIGLYRDNAGANCNIVETFPLTFVYVVHFSPGGAMGCEFSAPKPACWTNAIWLSDQESFENPGTSQYGKSVGYGTCRTGATHVLTIIYFAQGTGEPCCMYPVRPHTLANVVYAVDCSFNLQTAAGLTATVNGNATCPCGFPVPVEETTWGKVKSLYIE